MTERDRQGPDSGGWEIVPVARETWHCRHDAGVAEFEATGSTSGGGSASSGEVPVILLWVASLRWVGDREGEPMADADRGRILSAAAAFFRSRGERLELALPSGELQDEHGRLRSGFKSALPLAQHSDGWAIEDLWMSPAYPRADDYPPSIRYVDASGVAEIPRAIEVADGVRRRVIDGSGVRWTGVRRDDRVSAEERARILHRVRIVYEHWGEPFRFE